MAFFGQPYAHFQLTEGLCSIPPLDIIINLTIEDRLKYINPVISGSTRPTTITMPMIVEFLEMLRPNLKASIFPIELYLSVASFVERRGDLLALASTCHALYDILVPDYIDFIEIESPLFTNDELWTRFKERSIFYDRVRSLKLTDTSDDYHAYHPGPQEISSIDESLIYTILPRLGNLQRFKGFFNSSSKVSLSRLAQCLKQSGCILEELELNIRKWIFADYRSGRCSISSFTLDMPSLTRLTIAVSDYDETESGGLIQIFSKLPKLSHLSLSLPNRDYHINDFLHDLFTKCTWPNLKHMALKQIYQPNVIVEAFRPAMSKFLLRHSELESFDFDNTIFPGCFSGDVAWKLKALHFIFPNPDAAVFIQIGSVLPHHLTKNLVHLSLVGTSSVKLGIEPNGLWSLKTCSLPRIVSETQLLWMAEFIKAAPNLNKCSVGINSCFDYNTIIEVIQLFSALRDLTHLINLVSKIDISEGAGLEILAHLYEIPSLTYVNATVRSDGQQFIQLHRSTELQSSYEIVTRSKLKFLDYTKWGKFY